MNEVSIIGVDLAKSVFQVHGAGPDGTAHFRKKLTRIQFLPFLSQQPNCIVAMEACATAHGWARAISELGHEAKLIPPQYVKPFVKRQKNDMADAEAIAEAASRPTMRFVEIKSEESQARAMIFRTRQMLVHQRTQSLNALRSHLAEYGVIAPKSRFRTDQLARLVEDKDITLPDLVRVTGVMYLEHIEALTNRISELNDQIKAVVRSSKTAKRLQSMPGVGLQTSIAIEAFAPDMRCFKCGRDFAAWLGLVPKQHSSGGKERLGKVSKHGQQDIRTNLISGAMSVIVAVTRFGKQPTEWLARMLERKPKKLVAIALANKMARGIWAMMTKGEDYRNPVATA